MTARCANVWHTPGFECLLVLAFAVGSGEPNGYYHCSHVANWRVVDKIWQWSQEEIKSGPLLRIARSNSRHGRVLGVALLLYYKSRRRIF